MEEREREDEAERLRYERSENDASAGGVAPGGAAQFDRSNQTRREDLDQDELNGTGQDMRGTQAPHTRDDSNQPSRPDHPSNEDRGRASQSGGRGG
jgi:hypothetical protein